MTDQEIQESAANIGKWADLGAHALLEKLRLERNKTAARGTFAPFYPGQTEITAIAVAAASSAIAGLLVALHERGIDAKVPDPESWKGLGK